MQITILNNVPYLYLEGKVINLTHVVSMVPSYKKDVTMIYVTTSDKALSFTTPVKEIHDFLIDCEDYYGE